MTTPASPGLPNQSSRNLDLFLGFRLLNQRTDEANTEITVSKVGFEACLVILREALIEIGSDLFRRGASPPSAGRIGPSLRVDHSDYFVLIHAADRGGGVGHLVLLSLFHGHEPAFSAFLSNFLPQSFQNVSNAAVDSLRVA